MKTFIKWTLSIIATTAIISGIVYAAAPLINSVTTQPIASGSVMGENWFQMVNDKLKWTYGVNWKVCITDATGTINCNAPILVSTTGTPYASINDSLKVVNAASKIIEIDPANWIKFPDGSVQTKAANGGIDGGFYTVAGACSVNNPVTSALTCPTGFTPLQIYTDWYDWGSCPGTMILYWCRSLANIPPPTCSDGIKNQGETKVDCGGPNCSACTTCDPVTTYPNCICFNMWTPTLLGYPDVWVTLSNGQTSGPATECQPEYACAAGTISILNPALPSTCF